MEKVLKTKGHNPLLVRDDVGIAKPSTRTLPHEQHAYGKPDKKDPEGVNESMFLLSSSIAVTTSWAFHE